MASSTSTTEIHLERARAPLTWFWALFVFVTGPVLTGTWYLAGRLGNMEQRLALIEYRLSVREGHTAANSIPIKSGNHLIEIFPAELVRDEEHF